MWNKGKKGKVIKNRTLNEAKEIAVLGTVILAFEGTDTWPWAL